MSNFLAIATVTAALSRALNDVVVADVPGASVTTARPDSAGAGTRPPTVNIYLSRITPNPHWRNADLPTRGSGGELVQQPKAALDLHYLLNFYGDEGKLEPQRLLGSVVRALHSQPILTRKMIQDTMTDPKFSYLADSDLANDIELVRFAPVNLSLEELSKLWSVFFQTPYALTVVYEASVVLIEDKLTPRATLPVRAPELYVIPFRQPLIERVMSQDGPDQPIVMGKTLMILGQRLLADVVRVQIAGVEVTPQNASDTQITLQLSSLPADTLRAGVQGLQVVQPILMGEPATEHRGVESNVAAFVLRPTVTGVQVSNVQDAGNNTRSADITVNIDPKIGKSQRVVLLLNEGVKDTPAAYSFPAKPLNTDSSSITVSVTGVKAADYLVRIQVDGAESPLVADQNPASTTFNQYIGPKVTIP